MNNVVSTRKTSNIHAKFQPDRVSATLVLLRYGFSPSIIRCTTQLHQKTVARIKEEFLSLGYTDRYSKGGHKTAPNVILSDPKTYYAYNQLMILYSRFHCKDPSVVVDMEAILKAWTVYRTHAETEDNNIELDINSFWYLCLYLNALTVNFDEEDGGMMLFSKKDQAYYYHSNRSDAAVNKSGYIKSRSLKEIMESLQKKKQQASA
ncbi:MAG: hypothetical protein IAA31_05615 [Candidatus Anaerobiospirillum merdipullorum]|uniref:Uncharacterized protein n=1 Tax=Candidatus Anaerobiospirillum merdipullorum TaxID=2838450 RepID=A0A9E2KPA9_9GAMM|nr:hypothetical protein [Candidatus Anaerobiospirillum merdipullorum]